MKRFDTCFFERYARLTLMTLLGDEYAALVNRDRPDLQMEDGSLGIEVTRAMEPRKEVAVDMLKEMAGVEVPEGNRFPENDRVPENGQVSDKDREEIGQIIKSGYAYGLQDGRYVGHLEQEYWSLALPLRRIIASKIEKVGSGFYGNFKEYGLYIFCKDDLSYEDVVMTMDYASDLQRHLDVKYSKIYLSLIDRLYVCDFSDTEDFCGLAASNQFAGSSDDKPVCKPACMSYPISLDMRRWFFMEALDN